MPGPNGRGSDLGRLIAKIKALYDLYGVVVYAALYLDGEIKERRRRRRAKKAKR